MTFGPKVSAQRTHSIYRNDSNPQENPQQQQQALCKESPSITFHNLLTAFNSCDTEGRGTIPLESAQQIGQQNGISSQQFKEYCDHFKMVEGRWIAFDQLLFVVRLSENECLDIQSKSQQFGHVDQRLLQFLRMLNQNRKEAERSHNYSEAKCCKQKIKSIRANELKRIQRYLQSLRDREIKGLQSKQHESFEDFITRWDLFMADYDNNVAALIHEMSQRQKTQLSEYAKKLKKELASRVHHSKQVIDLMARQSYLVKQQRYSEAESCQKFITRQKSEELIIKEREDTRTIANKCEGLKKSHQANMSSLLQNVERDRFDHRRQRKIETEKMLILRKSQLSEINRRHQQSAKSACRALHNILIDDEKMRAYKINSY